MKQFDFQHPYLRLKVEKAPLFIRAVLFTFAFVFFVCPSLSMLINLLDGNSPTFGYFIFIAGFAIMGFYLLRISLWNTYGEELIQILGDKVTYEADYGWFTDGKKEIIFTVPNYSIKPSGYKNENKGVLLIGTSESQIESVVEMPTAELEELIVLLEKTTGGS